MSNKTEFDLSGSPVPNTIALQAAIIAEAESLPQYKELETSTVKSSRRWLTYFQVSLPLAACFLVALLIVTGTSNVSEPNSELSAVEELDWQEIMLFEDEWLLADL